MLRKRTRPVQEDQSKGYLMPHSSSASCVSPNGVAKKTTSTSFLRVPGLLDGFCSKGLPESDAVWSPKSPLDRVFSCIGNSNLGLLRSTSTNGGRPKCWDSSRVGLGLVDTLNDESKPCCGKVLGNIVFGSQMRFNVSIPRSFQVGLRDDDDDPVGAAPEPLLSHGQGILAKPHAGPSKPCSIRSEMDMGLQGSKLEHGESGLLRSCSVDTGRSSRILSESFANELRSNSQLLGSDSKNSSPAKEDTNFDKIFGSLPVSILSSHEFISSLSASEIEQSEDYTCIISHGPNPRMTHIFGDCVLESHSIDSSAIKNKHSSMNLLSCSYDDSSSFSRKENLEEHEDICLHRGEKTGCEDEEASTNEEIDRPGVVAPAGSPDSAFNEETFFLEEIAFASNN